MDHLVYAAKDTTYALTMSNYGIVSLRIKDGGTGDQRACAAADTVRIGGQPVCAGTLVALWGMHRARTSPQREMAADFCRQWPDGMQVV